MIATAQTTPQTYDYRTATPEEQKNYGYVASFAQDAYANAGGWWSVIDADPIGRYARNATVAEIDGIIIASAEIMGIPASQVWDPRKVL